MRERFTLFLACALFVSAGDARAAVVAKDLEPIYQPFRVARAALAPDGRHVAFTVRERGVLEVHVYALDNPKIKTRIPFDPRRGAEPTFLAWASASRLVAGSDTPLVIGVDPTGLNNRTLFDARSLATSDGIGRPSVRVLGLADGDPASLLVETSSLVDGSVELELRQIDPQSGRQERRHVDDVDPPGGSLIADRQGRVRLVFSAGELPQRFRYRSAGPVSAWRWLDRVAGEATAKFLVTPQNFLGERSIPLGFDRDPEILYFASNVGRDTFGIYAFDFRTARRSELAIEDPEIDLAELSAPWANSPLVFDRARGTLAGIRRSGLEPGTRWLDPELEKTQAALARKFPGRSVQMLEWDDGRERFLALVTSNGDPGRYFVYHRRDGRCVEYLRRTSGLAPEKLNRSEPFTIAGGAASTSGYLTLPHAPAVAKPPLIVWLHDGPWQRTAPGYDRDAQALATMGFVVAQVDYRGSAGFGRARRESVRKEPDAGPLADVQAVVAWVQQSHAVDRRRTAIVGEGYGGYLALRALQRHPEAYRCAVSINAPVDLADLRRSLGSEARNQRQAEQDLLELIAAAPATPEEREARMEARMNRAMNTPPPPVDFQHELLRWFTAGAGNLAEVSVLRQAERLTKPVMLLHDPTHRHAPIASVRELRAALEKRKVPVAFSEIPPQFARGVLATRAQVVRRVGEFLNVTLYDFDVKVGEAKEKEGR